MLGRLQQRQHKPSWSLPLPRTRVNPWLLLPPNQPIMTSVLRIIRTAIIHIMTTYTSALGWGGGSAGVLPVAGGGVVGDGEDVAGAATLTAVPGTVMATTAMGTMAMAMVTTGMATVITGMAIRMDGPAGILPGHPIPADTQVGMPGQAEDLWVVNLAESDSLADTVGLWP